MRRLLAFTVVLVVVLVILIPALVVKLSASVQEERKVQKLQNEDLTINVYMHEQNKIVAMNLEEYIKGVVAAEMPGEFEPEALKAQAVAARTFAVKNMHAFGGSGVPDHPGADVSTDHRQSQAWLDASQLRIRWGPFNYDRIWAKISKAVEQTRGEIVSYNGEPIQAFFHSTSGQRTASAKEVWGVDYPYLQSVACSWDEKSPRYSESREITVAQLEERLGKEAGVLAAVQSGDNSVVKIMNYTSSGRVDQVRIGSKTFTGQEVREKLELRSTNFAAENKGDKIVFSTVGYGHGVGLCQYGANGMAKEGKDYKQILTYYYTGVAIRNIFGS